MADYQKFNQFPEDLAHGVYDFSSDQFVIALCPPTSAPAPSDAVLSDLVQIDYTNLSPRNVTLISSGQTNGIYRPVFADLTLMANGPVDTFQFVVIYDDTPVNPLDPIVAFYDEGREVTLLSGETYTIDLSQSEGLFALA